MMDGKAKAELTVNVETTSTPQLRAAAPSPRAIWILVISIHIFVSIIVGCYYWLTQASDWNYNHPNHHGSNVDGNVLPVILASIDGYDTLGFRRGDNEAINDKGVHRQILLSVEGPGGHGATYSEPVSIPLVSEHDASIVVQLRYRIEVTSSAINKPTSPIVCQVLMRLDDITIGQAPYDFLGQVLVDEYNVDSDWKNFRSMQKLAISAGEHSLRIIGYCSQGTVNALVSIDQLNIQLSKTRKSADNFRLAKKSSLATSRLLSSRLAVDTSNPKLHAQMIVDRLDLTRFKYNIQTLSNFGDRTQGSTSYFKAAAWVEQTLTGYGYQVKREPYTYSGRARDSMYVTKVGTTFPDRMFLVSAHLDGRGGGGAANDDASGCSLLLEMARTLAMNDVTTQVSIRLLFWNNEETGLNGSFAYAQQRKAIRGKESPVGSGLYPEPTWLGLIQHDQILFDHGLPVQVEQSPDADLNIEYVGSGSSVFKKQSQELAYALKTGNADYAQWYNATVGDKMSSTDSMCFVDYTASVSVRENERIAGIGQGSQPNWHKATDVYSTYSEDDFRFGLNVVQTTLGTVAELAGAEVNLVSSCLKIIRTTCQCSSSTSECYTTTLANKCVSPIYSKENRLFQNRLQQRYNRYCSLRIGRYSGQ